MFGMVILRFPSIHLFGATPELLAFRQPMQKRIELLPALGIIVPQNGASVARKLTGDLDAACRGELLQALQQQVERLCGHLRLIGYGIHTSVHRGVGES
jgi:hypothetical protein